MAVANAHPLGATPWKRAGLHRASSARMTEGLITPAESQALPARRARRCRSCRRASCTGCNVAMPEGTRADGQAGHFLSQRSPADAGRCRHDGEALERRPRPKTDVRNDRAEGQEGRRPRRRHRRQHRAVHRRPHRQRPALPRLRHPRHRRAAASSRRSPTCSSTARCRTAAQLAAYKAKLRALRGLPHARARGAGGAAGGDASDGRDAHRHLRARLRAAGEGGPQPGRRARHRRPHHGVPAARSCSTGITGRTTAAASRSRRTTTASAATSCICCTARRRRPSGCGRCTRA